MRSSIYSTLLISSLLLTGCATKIQPNEVDFTPDVETVQQMGGKAVYLNTLFTVQDFNKEQELRSFEEYNYSVESSPCTVLGFTYEPGNQIKDSFYRVPKNGKNLDFICRKAYGSNNKNERRLYLINSKYDCNTRPSYYKYSSNLFYKEMDNVCRKELKGGKEQTTVDNIYNGFFLN